MQRQLQSSVVAYLGGSALVGIATLITWLAPELRVAPLLYVGPIMFSAWLGGMWPAMFATVLSVVALDYLMLEPRYALGIVSANDVLDLTVFTLIAVVTSWLAKQRHLAEQSMQQFASQLQEADRHKDEFLAVLAHELRNPLAAIHYSSQLIELDGECERNENLRSSCRVIRDHVDQLTGLIDELLDVGRIRSGKIELEREVVDLRTVVNEACTTCDPAIRQRNHELTVSQPNDPVWLDADPARLRQVLINLLNNAAKYTDPGGQIQVLVDRGRELGIVRVRDNGVGITQEMLPRVFELFTQVDATRNRSQGGLGIGLSIVHRLVEMHGGTIEARSAGSGQGSDFIVRLPATNGPPPSDAARAVPKEAGATP